MMRANKITNNGEVLLDLTQDTATPETVGEGVTFHTADGSPAVGTAKLGGGAELNIAYGDMPPEDTSKLWVKMSEPSKMLISSSPNNIVEMVETLSCNLTAGEYGIGCAAVGTKVYYFGGHLKNGSIRYLDTETNTLTTLTATLPQKATSVGCAAVGTKIYVFGGLSGNSNTNKIYCFDTETNEITDTNTTFPTARQKVQCVPIDGQIYILAGSGFSGTLAEYPVYCYDPTTNTVSTMPFTISNRLMSGKAVGVGHRIYVFGNFYYLDAQCVDLDTNTVTTLSTLPEGCYRAETVVVDNLIYFLGGVSKENESVFLDGIHCFDTRSLTTKKMDMTLPYLVGYGGCASVGKNIYYAGGRNGSTYYTTIIHALFDVSVETDTLLITIGETNLFNLIELDNGAVEIGIKGVYFGVGDGNAEPVESALYKDGAWTNI